MAQQSLLTVTRILALKSLGLGAPSSWLVTFAFAVAWLALMMAYTPVADRFATRLVAKPPTLGAFRALQQSVWKLMAGIVIAWILGGFLEEIIFRGIVLRAIEAFASERLPGTLAVIIAVALAALGAGILHLYQGPRAATIITQLSVLFGVLFVVSGYNLWSVILCHGLYDTIAFIRFARRKSKYSQLNEGAGGGRNA